MNLTQEKLDELESQLKDMLEDLKSAQQRDSDKLRVLLSTITGLRAGLVMSRAEGATE